MALIARWWVRLPLTFVACAPRSRIRARAFVTKVNTSASRRVRQGRQSNMAKDSRVARERRHHRVRIKVSGTPERPRLNVYRSLDNIYAQVIDDVAGHTLVSASTLDGEVK